MALTDPYGLVVFTENDGAYAALSALSSSAGIPDGDFWTYFPTSGSYGSMHMDDMDISNSAVDVYMSALRSFRVYSCLRPVKTGTQMASGFTATSYKMIDDDPTNFLSTGASDYTVAFVCPDIDTLGGKLLAVYVALVADLYYATNYGAIDFGLWDISAGAWVNGKKHSYTSTASGKRGLISATPYYESDVTAAVRPDFRSGRLLDTAATPGNLEIRASITSTGKGNDFFYDVALVALIETPGKSIDMKSVITIDPGYNIHNHDLDAEGSTPVIVSYKMRRQGAVSGTQFLFGGKCQKDDASGTCTGSASSLIVKAPSIAQHILQKLGGYSVNVTPGTLGNFVDARVETVAKEQHLALYFGLEPTTIQDAITELQRRWPMRLTETDGVWNIILDEMNPNVNRMYRSSSDPIRISARRDIVEGSFEVSAPPPAGIQNNFELRYAHAYGTNKPMGSTTYSHALSREAFYSGALPLRVVDEQWIPRNDLLTENPHPAATYLAQWLGRKNARPRLNVKLALRRESFDLKRGHVLEFDDDMEGYGYFCPAYRCGMLDYAYVSSSDATNYANSATPKYVAASGSGYAYFMASQQFPCLDFFVATPAGYTTVANAWKYCDGASWLSLSNVVNPDAMKSAGAQRVSWDRPLLTSWHKGEFSFSGATKGPCYPVRMEYTSATAQGLGYAPTTHPGTWRGRIFEVIENTIRVGAMAQYPYIDVVLKEVM